MRCASAALALAALAAGASRPSTSLTCFASVCSSRSASRCFSAALLPSSFSSWSCISSRATSAYCFFWSAESEPQRVWSSLSSDESPFSSCASFLTSVSVSASSTCCMRDRSLSSAPLASVLSSSDFAFSCSLW